MIRKLYYLIKRKICFLRTIIFESNLYEKIYIKSPFSIKLQKNLPSKYKIGMAVLAYERPHCLEACLDALFQTKLYDYDVTFLLHDDGSKDPHVRKILNRRWDSKYKIIRYFTENGGGTTGAAINKAMGRLMEIDDFDIIGWCESDTIHHPEWLDRLIKVARWAKKHQRNHLLGPFSAFNSSDVSHRVLGHYQTPFGAYVIKYQMGLVNYFYFKEDFLKLGFYEKDMHEEKLMADKFEKLKVRHFCLLESYVEHIGIDSIVNDEARLMRKEKDPVNFVRSTHGMNLPENSWPQILAQFETLGYYKYVKGYKTFGEKVSDSQMELDVIILTSPEHLQFLPFTIQSVKKYLKHPIGKFYLVAPDSSAVDKICSEFGCILLSEKEISPISHTDINFSYRGLDRSKWLYQQMIKFSLDKLSGANHIFLIDANTVLTSPQVFEYNGRITFLHSDEYYYPYFIHLDQLLDLHSVQLSFVAYQALFEKKKLTELKKEIELIHGQSWFMAILDLLGNSIKSRFSEYETYGHWMLHRYPEEIQREYWYNHTYNRSEISKIGIDKLIEISKNIYRSITFS